MAIRTHSESGRNIRRRGRASWVSAGELVGAFKKRIGIRADRMAILDVVWPRETGSLARHWRLAGVRGTILYVRPASSAAAQELRLRAPDLLRRLNKHFGTAWITSIRTMA